MPVMGGMPFVVVDSDRETVDYIEKPSDIMNLGKDTGRLDGTDAGNRKGRDEGSEEEEEEKEEKKGGKRLRMSLEKGETMDAPQQLAQYYMMVTCKWRLAALLCFLKTHSHQKVMVFFSTCDSVDFHALLFREAAWPQDLDAAIEGSGDTDSATNSNPKVNNSDKNTPKERFPGFQDGHSTSSGGGNHFIEPLPSKFGGMFGEECYMYRLHGNVPQNVRQTVYKVIELKKSYLSIFRIFIFLFDI
jgi:hypothetical protein